MDMVRHHAKLQRFQDRVFIREMDDGFCYDFSQDSFVYFRAAWDAGSESCISGNFPEDIAVPSFFNDNVIDERGPIIMRESSPMIGMCAGFCERLDS